MVLGRFQVVVEFKDGLSLRDAKRETKLQETQDLSNTVTRDKYTSNKSFMRVKVPSEKGYKRQS